MVYLNFIVNILAYSLLRKSIAFIVYGFLRMLSVASQLLFFQVAVSYFFREVQVVSDVIYGLCPSFFGSVFSVLTVLMIVIVLSSYWSRSAALIIIRSFIVYLLDHKLADKSNRGLNWVRPIVVELWNSLDSFFILFFITFLGVVYVESYYFVLLILLVFVFLIVLSITFISKWSSKKHDGSHDLLFWRLQSQNRVESIMLFMLFFMLVVFVLSSNYYAYEAEYVAVLFLLLKVFVGVATQLVSSLPRITRYLSKLPAWPVFWSRKLWF